MFKNIFAAFSRSGVSPRSQAQTLMIVEMMEHNFLVFPPTI